MILAAVLFTAAVLIIAILLRLPLWLTLLLLILFTPAGGISLQLTVSVISYIGTCIAAIFSYGIREDMKLIRFCPFNSDGEAALRSRKVTFYKGVPVFRPNIKRSGSMAIILLDRRDDLNDLKHERGHNWQLMSMGIATYLIAVAIPSPAMLGRWAREGNYYGAPWEAIADILGGAERDHEVKETAGAGAYFAAGLFMLPAPFWWISRKKRDNKSIKNRGPKARGRVDK